MAMAGEHINLESRHLKDIFAGLAALLHRGSASGIAEGFSTSRVFRTGSVAVAVPPTVYFRKGSDFEEVSKLPYEGDNFSLCPQEKPSEKDRGDKYLKTPFRGHYSACEMAAVWRPGIRATFESEMENGGTRGCGQTLTIAFDSDHKASVKSAKQHD